MKYLKIIHIDYVNSNIYVKSLQNRRVKNHLFLDRKRTKDNENFVHWDSVNN